VDELNAAVMEKIETVLDNKRVYPEY